jgi:hypothetical protein
MINTKISKVLIENADQIGKFLNQMYPGHEEIISYHQKEGFNEWFAFLFDGNKWILDGPKEIPIHKILISKSEFNKVEVDFKENNILMENFDYNKIGYLTVVKPDDLYRIVDGWHRFYMCNVKDLVNVPVYEWIKKENSSPFALQIRDLILNNL